MRDLTALSDVITLAIKAAMQPLLERLAVAETHISQAVRAEQALTELRDRLVAMETKMAMPLPVLESTPVDLAPLEKRLGELEWITGGMPEIKNRLNSLEQRADGAVLSAEHEKGLSTIRERLAVVETRAPIPGPPGKDGANGAKGQDGLNGKDGADGFAFEDLSVVQQDDCSFTVKAIKGDRVKDIGTVKFPVERYRGVYNESKTYERGECVTWGGSEWHCNETTTTKPGEGLKAWTLKVKRGRDGKDGRDAVSLPVISVGAK